MFFVVGVYVIVLCGVVDGNVGFDVVVDGWMCGLWSVFGVCQV